MKGKTLGCAIWLLSIIASTAWAKDIPQLNVGVILPTTGSLAAFGQEAMRGVALAERTIQQTHPELAAKLNFVRIDNSSSPSMTTKVAEAFLKKGGHILMGGVTNTNTLSLARVAKQRRRILISPIAANFGLDDPKRSYVYKLRPNEETKAESLARYTSESLKLKRGVMLLSAGAEVQHIGRQYQKSLAQYGGQIVKVFMVQRNMDLGAVKKVLREIKRYKPEFVFTPLNKTDFPESFKSQQLGVPLIASRVTTFDFLPSSDVPKYYLSEYSTQNPSATSQNFAGLYHKEYGRAPTSLAALMYDSTLLITELGKKSHTHMTRSLEIALQKMTTIPESLNSLRRSKQTSHFLSNLVVMKEEAGVKVFETELGSPL